jgi:hypothetical protein
VVYELVGRLSRAFSSRALAAFTIAAEVFGRVVRLGEPGLRGSGGGARSGSELSHLRGKSLDVSGLTIVCHVSGLRGQTYMGIEEKEW